MTHVERVTPIKTSMLKSSLCDYAYILVSGIITVLNTRTAAAPNNRKNIKVKNSLLFTNCIREINNIQIDKARDIKIVMLMYNLTEYSGSCSKTSRSLRQYYGAEPALNSDGDAIDFPADGNDSDSFKSKAKIVNKTGNNGTKIVKTVVPIKYLRNFWKLVDCEINLILTWSTNCFNIVGAIDSQVPTFTMADTKCGFKRIINWNKYQATVTIN